MLYATDRNSYSTALLSILLNPELLLCLNNLNKSLLLI